MHYKGRIVAVVGPTGSGKTALGVELAKRYNGVILSADSRQVYCGLDVGTNKQGIVGRWQSHPARLIDDVPQLLIDIAQPGQRFTLADWLAEAQTAIEQIWQAGQLPIIVGGTGLYVTALLSGWTLKNSLPKLPLDRFLILMSATDRAELYAKADQRCQSVLPALAAECQQLIDQGVNEDWIRQLGLDYRFGLGALHQSQSDEVLRNYQIATHAYIRRQLTWWRHHEPVTNVTDTKTAIAATQQFLAS